MANFNDQSASFLDGEFEGAIIRDVASDKDGKTLWIASSRGISKWDKNGKIKFNGLPLLIRNRKQKSH